MAGGQSLERRRLAAAERDTAGAGTMQAGAALTALFFLVLAGACALVFLVVTGLLASDRLPVFAQVWYENAAHLFATRLDQLLWAGASGLLGIGCAHLSLRALAPTPAPPARHILRADDKGLVVVDSRSVSGVAEAAVMQTGEVLDVQVRVRGLGRAPVRLKIKALVNGRHDLPRAGDAARRAAREAVETLVGIEVGDVVVDLEVLPPEAWERTLQ